MKLLKVALVLVVLLVALGAAGVVIGLMMIDRLAARGVEAGGSYALGVPTELDSADVGVFGGTVELEGLHVANPEGYKADRFLTLGDGDMAVSLGTLREDVVEVPSVTLSDIDVYLERSDGKANYQVIIDNLKRFESGEKPPPEEQPGKRFILRRVEITDVVAHVSLLPVGGDLTTAEVVVPQIVLTDVGADEPLKLGEVVNVVMQAVLATIAANSGGVLPEDFGAELGAQLAQLEALRDVAGSVEEIKAGVEAIRERAGGLGEELEGAGDRLKGILGGDEEKDDGGG